MLGLAGLEESTGEGQLKKKKKKSSKIYHCVFFPFFFSGNKSFFSVDSKAIGKEQLLTTSNIYFYIS